MSTQSDATKVQKSDAEWREPADAGAIPCHAPTRNRTAPSPVPLNDEKRAGTYACVCCGEPLFRSETKFDSGTGWPSFFDPVSEEAVDDHEDRALFMRRTENRCAKCDAHLGHVFPDGPRPTGLRYCMNGVALNFEPDEVLMLDKRAADPPLAERRPVTVTPHGVTLEDPYAWLRAENWREVMADPSVLASDIHGYLDAENAYTEAVLAPVEALRESLVKELRGRIAEDDWSVPTPDGQYAYGMTYVEGDEHPRLIRMLRHVGEAVGAETPPESDRRGSPRRQPRSGGRRLLPPRLGLPFAGPPDASPGPATAPGGELFTLALRDLATGADTVLHERVTPSVTIAGDERHGAGGRGGRQPPPRQGAGAQRGRRARTTLYEETDPGFFVSVGPHAVRPLHRHRQPRPSDVRGPPHRRARPALARHPGRAAPGGGGVRRRPHRRFALHPHQPRGARFPDRSRPGRRSPAARTGRTSSPTARASSSST